MCRCHRCPQVPYHRKLARWISHGGQKPLTFGKPLAIDLYVEDYNWDGEHPPNHLIAQSLGRNERQGLKQEKPRDRRSEQVVYPYVVQELSLNHSEVKQTSEGVEKRLRDQREEG